MTTDFSVTRAASTIREMMNARGYRETTARPIITGNYPPMSFSDKKGKECVAVKWLLPETGRVGVKDTRMLIEEMIKAGITHVIIVLSKDLTSFAANELSNCTSIKIEKWLLYNLQVNPTSFFLTPTQRLLTTQEKKSIGVKLAKLPKMLSNDAIARFYGAKKGAVFKIERQSPDGCKYNVYRIVI